MKTTFLGREYIILALINAKKLIFNENFTTLTEISQFCYYLQTEIRRQNLDIIITSYYPSLPDFNVTGECVIPTSECCYDLNRAPLSILKIFYDLDFFTKFFLELEQERHETLTKAQNNNLKLFRKPIY